MSESNLNTNDDNYHKTDAETKNEDKEQLTNLDQVDVGTSVSKNSIAAMLKSSGPMVKCVLLKHMRSSGRDVHPHLDPSVIAKKKHPHSVNDDDSSKPVGITTVAIDEHHRVVLTELIEELEVDTTPGENGVQKALGGSTFTFVGQYPDQGIVLMARADQFHDVDEIDTLSVKELKAFIKDSNLDIDLTTVVDKSELIQAVKSAQLPLNPHRLQPPFHDCSIRGDILLMRIADDADEEEDEEDDDGGDDDDVEEEEEDNEVDDKKTSLAISNAIKEITTATAIPNDEFFLDYTKEEYIAFASRTDIVAAPTDDDEEEVDDEEEEEGENDEDDDDDEDNLDDEEEDKHLLLNLILSEVIKSFREENRRGPDSEELLDLRSRIAAQLNLPLPPPAPQIPEDDRKRKIIEDQQDSTSPSPKKVKFTPDILEKEEEDGNCIIGTADRERDENKIVDHDADDANTEGQNDR